MHRKVFDDTIYYFDKIPTVVQPFTVGWIVAGALLIAVLASIWPAQRAAHVHPVRSLRSNRVDCRSRGSESGCPVRCPGPICRASA